MAPNISIRFYVFEQIFSLVIPKVYGNGIFGFKPQVLVVDILQSLSGAQSVKMQIFKKISLRFEESYNIERSEGKIFDLKA